MKTITIIAAMLLTLTSFGQMDSTYYRKYALLSYAEYNSFNHDLSIAKGYELGKHTERLLTLNPQLAKVNVTYKDSVENYDIACVASISGEDQYKYPKIMPTLYDSYTPLNTTLTSLEISSNTDWLINHYNAVGSKSINLIISNDERTKNSNLSVNKLIEKDITIITKKPQLFKSKTECVSILKDTKIEVAKDGKVILNKALPFDMIVETKQVFKEVKKEIIKKEIIRK